MMNWFWRWLDGKMANALQESESSESEWKSNPNKLVGVRRGALRPFSEPVREGPPEVESESPLTFTVHHANGGIIIQQVSYNRHADDRKVRLHLVHENADIAKEIGDIVALELIRKQ